MFDQQESLLKLSVSATCDSGEPLILLCLRLGLYMYIRFVHGPLFLSLLQLVNLQTDRLFLLFYFLQFSPPRTCPNYTAVSCTLL